MARPYGNKDMNYRNEVINICVTARWLEQSRLSDRLLSLALFDRHLILDAVHALNISDEIGD